jgi:hypothetical protein
MFLSTDSYGVAASSECSRCDRLLDLNGYHVTRVEGDDTGHLIVEIESSRSSLGCPGCGVHRESRAQGTPSLTNPRFNSLTSNVSYDNGARNAASAVIDIPPPVRLVLP